MNAPSPAAHPLASFGIDMLARGAARLRGDRPAIMEAGAGATEAAVSYRELDALVLAFSAQIAEAGLEPGHRILIVGAPRAAVLIAILGALGAGLEPVMAPVHTTSATLAFLAQTTAARAIVGPTAFAGLDGEKQLLETAACARDIRMVGALGPMAMDGATDLSPQALRSAYAPAPRAPRAGEPPRIGIVLRPQDGLPRATFLPQATVVAQALDVVSHLRLTADRPIVSTLSLASVGGLLAGPVAALLAGAPLALFAPFDAAGLSAVLERAGPCHLLAPEAVGQDLVNAGLTEGLESLALTCAAGSTAAPALQGSGCPVALIRIEDGGGLQVVRA